MVICAAKNKNELLDDDDQQDVGPVYIHKTVAIIRSL
jgi:hypothetical protein